MPKKVHEIVDAIERSNPGKYTEAQRWAMANAKYKEMKKKKKKK